MTIKVIVSGRVSGIVVKSSDPINFLGGVDKKTGMIKDAKYDIAGRSIGSAILVFPHGVGSSVGAYTIYSLKANDCAPRAMICTKADLTVASGCALADIPFVIVDAEQFDSIADNTQITLDTGTRSIT